MNGIKLLYSYAQVEQIVQNDLVALGSAWTLKFFSDELSHESSGNGLGRALQTRGWFATKTPKAVGSM
jgi:hypothetical protein